MLFKTAWQIAFAIIWTSNYAFSQYDFNIEQIPDSLLTNVNSVIRHSFTNVEILEDKIIYKYDYAITALNKKHEDQLLFYENFQKNEGKIIDLKIAIFDADGELIKKVKGKEVKEYGIQDIEFTKGTLTLHYAYKSESYPKTIHVTYELHIESPYYLRTWLPVSTFKQSVERASISINDLVGQSFEYLTHDLIEQNEVSTDVISFHYDSKKAFHKEKYMPNLFDCLPKLEFSLRRLNYHGHDGYITGWNEFGSWAFKEMYLPKQDIDLSILRDETSKIIDETDDKLEIAKKLYQYIQRNTRYVLIILGDGGWSPLPVSVVHSRKYGDCKALSFYYNTLCKAYDIEATLALVKAGEEKQSAHKDFYNTVQFNHVISKLDIDGQSYWVDCTSKKNPFNYLGDFTDDRNVLLINREKGIIDRTPKYECLQTTSSTLEFSEVSGLKAHVKIATKGIGITDKLFEHSKTGAQEKATYQKSLISNYTNPIIEDFSFEFDTTNLQVREQITIQSKNAGERFGKHIKIKLNHGEIDVPKLKRDKKRDWPVKFVRDKEFKAFTKLKHDLNLVPLKEDDVSLESEFGSYSFKTTASAGEVLIERKLKINEGVYAPRRYKEVKSFFDKIKKVEKRTILLSNKS